MDLEPRQLSKAHRPLIELTLSARTPRPQSRHTDQYDVVEHLLVLMFHCAVCLHLLTSMFHLPLDAASYKLKTTLMDYNSS